jgi:hypothetical protein
MFVWDIGKCIGFLITFSIFLDFGVVIAFVETLGFIPSL